MRLTAFLPRVHARGREALRWLARPVGLGGAVAGLVLMLIVAVSFIPGEGEVRYSDIARLEFPVPHLAGEPVPVAAGERHVAALVVGRDASIRPGPLDPDLVEQGDYRPLPRVGRDGTRPAFVYARRFDAGDDRPRVAIVLAGLGLHGEIAQAALAPPGPITLRFSPRSGTFPS